MSRATRFMNAMRYLFSNDQSIVETKVVTQYRDKIQYKEVERSEHIKERPRHAGSNLNDSPQLQNNWKKQA